MLPVGKTVITQAPSGQITSVTHNKHEMIHALRRCAAKAPLDGYNPHGENNTSRYQPTQTSYGSSASDASNASFKHQPDSLHSKY
jgi:hypothetical protein